MTTTPRVELIAKVMQTVLNLALLALGVILIIFLGCLLYTSPSPRDRQKSRMPSSA